jgi:hypothetical protein
MLSIVIMNVIILNAIILSIIILSVVVLGVVMLIVIMLIANVLNVFGQNVVMFKVMRPKNHTFLSYVSLSIKIFNAVCLKLFQVGPML